MVESLREQKNERRLKSTYHLEYRPRTPKEIKHQEAESEADWQIKETQESISIPLATFFTYSVTYVSSYLGNGHQIVQLLALSLFCIVRTLDFP